MLVIIILLIIVFWISFSYSVNYKKEVCDIIVSPNKKYELTLQAIGEPEWPFGIARGRLVLKADDHTIAETDFELRNNGKKINHDCWKVTWFTDYVEVILSGDEQFDQQILLYFDGKKESKQMNSESAGIAFSEEERTEIQSNYENYAGTWSEEGKSHESIMSEGGTEFLVEITSDNALRGYLYSQQEISGRIAEIKDIICDIEDGECYYPFSDDGWGNSGVLYIQFEKNVIKISVQDFMVGETNTSGFGIDRTYILSKEEKSDTNTEYNNGETEQLLQYDVNWSEEQVQNEIRKRVIYLNKCSYYDEVLDFLENSREVRDISMYINPLYYTDIEYYDEDNFAGVPLLIIHLAKNEIYARHGYIFKDENLKNYFKGQLWYIPSVEAEEFDDSVFNDIEKKNLELLNELDTYKK